MEGFSRFRCTTSVAAVFGVLLSALVPCGAEQRTASKQSPSVSLGAKASQMLKALDTIEGDVEVKAVSIIEINEVGETDLYQYVRFRNPSSKPLEDLRGIGSFADIPYLSVGGHQAMVEWGEYLPNKIERKFTAHLQHPVPPGEWIEMIMVGRRVAKYKARRLQNGRWRLGPVTAEVAGSSAIAIFAIKLPPGARLFDFQPKPDSVSRGDPPVAIWHQTLAEGKDLKLYAEYEAGEKGTEGEKEEKRGHSTPLEK